MPNQLPELILIFSLIVSILFIVLGIVLIVNRVFKFTSDLLSIVEKDRTKEANQLKAEAAAKAQKIIDEAHTTSLNTIKDSSEQAAKILKDAGVVSDTATQQIESATQTLLSQHNEKIQGISQQVMTDYSKLLENEKSADIKNLHDISLQMESSLAEQMSKFNKQLGENLALLSTSLSAEINAKYESLDKDIENYRKLKLQKIDESIYKILEEVSIQVLGKSISLNGTEAFIEKIIKEKINETA